MNNRKEKEQRRQPLLSPQNGRNFNWVLIIPRNEFFRKLILAVILINTGKTIIFGQIVTVIRRTAVLFNNTTPVSLSPATVPVPINIKAYQ